MAERVRHQGRVILSLVGLGRRVLSVSLVGDEEMSRLNGRYRGRGKATDVLSFALDEGPFGSLPHRMLGDVVICLQTAHRRARREHRSVGAVVERLLLHGILHLAGYDHERSPEEARAMRREEIEIGRVLRGRGRMPRPRRQGRASRPGRWARI